MPSKLRISLLGEVSIQKGDAPINGLPSRAAEALFIYLACNPRPVSREKLAELLWAERSPTQALTNLRTILTPLRRELGEYLSVERNTLAFTGAEQAWLDAVEFENQLKAAGIPADPRRLQSALDLYRGDFLEGFHLRDGYGFEEWAILQRERLRQLARDGFRALARSRVESGLYAEGLAAALRWQRLDPYDEDACRTLMWFLLRTGQRAAALQTYQTLHKKLEADLGVTPASATLDLFRRIQRLDFPPALQLPAFAIPFVGRDVEIAELKGYLLSRARLLTITGPGGIGKTRLAVEAARSLADQAPGGFLHGVYFVPLTTVDRPEALPARLAESIGFNFHGAESPQRQLFEHLREREALLILDNFEHLVDDAGAAIAFVVELLRRAPELQLVITSRERLNLYEETVFDLHGLDLPADGAQRPESSGAMALFAQNARRVQRSFVLDLAQAESVARICRLVEGAPLALELASAWVRHYPCAQIAAQIEQDLDFLSTPYRDAPEAHRSLRAVFERSWSLLSAREQIAFAQLSVFRGGFTLEAGEAILGEASDGWTPLADLADQSLLQRQPDGRHDIHPLLRQYAAEKLSALPAVRESAFARHTAHYLDFLTNLGGGESPEQRARIRPELDNLRLAWSRAAEAGDLSALERTAGVLHSFFSVQSWFVEGIALFADVLSIVERTQRSEADGLACELLGRKARMHTQIGQLDAARADLRQGLAHLEHLDDPSRRARVLDSLAITNYYAGDYPQATALARESLALSEAAGNQDGAAFALNFLGSCAKAQGDYAEARACFERSAAVYRAMQDEIGAAMVLNNLGNLLQNQGDFEGAQHYYVESGGIFKAHEHLHGAATTLSNAGKLAFKRGQHASARGLLTEGLELKRQVNDRRGEAVALAGLADIDLAESAHEQARERLKQALELALEVRDVQLMLDLLAAVADLTLRQRRRDLTLRLLSRIHPHPGAAEEARQRTNRLVTEVGALPPAAPGQEPLEEWIPALLLEL